MYNRVNQRKPFPHPNHPLVVRINKSPYDCYCGRAGKGQLGTFGNQYILGVDGDRQTVIAKYITDAERLFAIDAQFRELVLAQKGKRLGCFCDPDLCHANWIAYKANGLDTTEMHKWALEFIG